MIERHDRLPSTQDRLHQLAAAGAPAGAAVVAREQSAGRGSRGRAWHSPPGGLWVSVLCRPRDEAAVWVLSLRAGLAVARVLDGVLAERPGLKWPNDLMLRDRKLGGVLCEARWQGSGPGWVAVGIGLNVANPIPGPLAATAIALGEIRPGIGPDELVEPVVAAVAALSEAAGPLAPAELAAYAERDWLRGRRVLAPAPGIAEGITAAGALVVRQASGTTTLCSSGSVMLDGP